MTRSKTSPVKAADKTLLLTLGDGKESRVVVPEHCKVTFGPAIPGPAARNGYDNKAEYAVRIYKGATEKAGLLAVFTNVREFREESVKLSKLVIRESGKTLWQSDENGLEVTHSVKTDRTLIPDSFGGPLGKD